MFAVLNVCTRVSSGFFGLESKVKRWFSSTCQGLCNVTFLGCESLRVKGWTGDLQRFRGDQVGSQLESPGEKAKWLEFLNLNLFLGIFGGGSVLFRQKTHHLGELPNQEEMEKDDVEASFLYNRNSQSSESGWLINLLAFRLWELWEQLRKLFKESVAGRRPAIIFSSPNNIQHSNIQIFKNEVQCAVKDKEILKTLVEYPDEKLLHLIRLSEQVPHRLNHWSCKKRIIVQPGDLQPCRHRAKKWPVEDQFHYKRTNMVGIFICWRDELLRMFLRWDFNLANSEIRAGPNWGRF